MPSNYDRIDFKFSWNGDFLPDSDGDFADTSDDRIQSLFQDVHSIVASALEDWEEHPGMGADLDSFVGEPNTRQTAARMQTKVKDALVLYNVASSGDISVRVVPLTIHSVLIIVKILALATPNNSLDQNLAVTSMVFDYQDHGIFVLDRSVE